MVTFPKSPVPRCLPALVFVGLACLSWERGAGLPAQAGRTWFSAAEAARPFGHTVFPDFGPFLSVASRASIERAVEELSQAWRERPPLVNARLTMTESEIRARFAELDRQFETAAQHLQAALLSEPSLIVLRGERPELVSPRSLFLPVGKGLLLLYRERSAAVPPDFAWRKADLGSGASVRVELPEAVNLFAGIELLNAPPGENRFTLELTSARQPAIRLDLRVTVPPLFPLQVEIRDEAGDPTEAAVGLYSAHGEFLIPPNALDFSEAGYNYIPTRYRNQRRAKFWPGGPRFERCFFVDGGFRVWLPAGSYRLIAAKGPEYVPADQTLSVTSGATTSQTVRLKRWIDMSAKGWHSGDCHIHYARPQRETNHRLLLWARAEDLRMGNILRMGDARITFFEQYAFGKPGRFFEKQTALVPGQEDPRTGILGHTIGLNLAAPVRNSERYYVYSDIFDGIRRQGGLSGYAHVYNGNFSVSRDMTLNMPRGKVDFAEICGLGELNTDLYYEFLNLGFRLTATGGSDAPWGGTVGDSRTYVFTGKTFNADEWFEAFRAGRTFATAGPMLEFTVNGYPPGEELKVSRGQVLRIHARSSAGLEIVVNGEVIRAHSAALDLDMPAEKSMWIAARTRGAHTTPVYVTVEGRRHWKRSDVPALLEKRARDLDEIEKFLMMEGDVTGPGRYATWENSDAFQRGKPALRVMVREARGAYAGLRREYEAGR